MRQKDEKKRSKWFLIALAGVIAVIILAVALFFAGRNRNPLEGEWVMKSQGRYAYVDKDGKFTLKGAFGDAYVEVELSYTLNEKNQEITLKQGEANVYQDALENVKGELTEGQLKEMVEPMLSSYDYLLENDTLTLTEQKSGEQMILTKASKSKLNIATTTGDVKSISKNNEEEIRNLYEAGFRYIDFSMYTLDANSPLMQDDWKETALALKAVADELGMEFVQAHSPGTNPFGSKSDLTMATNIRAIEVCEVLGIENIVIHPGYESGLSKQQWFEKNKAFYNELLPTAEKCGVNVLCENSTSKNMGSKYNINTGADMREFIEYINHPNFHGCWDTGHANCEGSQYDDILALGDEMYAIHFHDNLGDGDKHLMPYYGNINVDEVMLAINMIGFKGYFTLECDGTTRALGAYTGPNLEGMDASKILDRMEEEKQLYQLTEYILKEHGMLAETR